MNEINETCSACFKVIDFLGRLVISPGFLVSVDDLDFYVGNSVNKGI